MVELRTFTAHIPGGARIEVQDRLMGKTRVSSLDGVPLEGLVEVLGSLVPHQESTWGSSKSSWTSDGDFDEMVRALDFVLQRQFGARRDDA